MLLEPFDHIHGGMEATAGEKAEQNECRYEEEEKDGEDLAIFAELLILSLSEVVRIPIEPSSIAGQALVALQTIRLQAVVANFTTKGIWLVDGADRAEGHEVETALARLFDDKVSSTLHDISLSWVVGLKFFGDEHTLIELKLVISVFILHVLDDGDRVCAGYEHLEHL